MANTKTAPQYPAVGTKVRYLTVELASTVFPDTTRTLERIPAKTFWHNWREA